MKKEAVWVNDKLFIDPPNAVALPLAELLAAGITEKTICTPAEAEACAQVFITLLERERAEARKDSFIVLRLVEPWPAPAAPVREWIDAMLARCRRELAEGALEEGESNGLQG